MPNRPIYMDNHSTTRVDPQVVELMIPYFSEIYGNAASVSHAFGWEAGEAVEKAREEAAKLLNADSKEIIFTSGATESNNLALKGVLRAAQPGSHLIITAAEHKSILDPAKVLEKAGYEVTILPVDQFGRVDSQQVIEAILPNTSLVSVIFANNEVGSINPISEIAHVCKEQDILFHTDATQAVGKVPIDLQETPIDLLSLSAHKMYGPKGIGALFVRRGERRIKIESLIDGGGHERRLRSGTLAVQQIVGLGEACQLCNKQMNAESKAISEMRDHLQCSLEAAIPNISFNGHQDERLPGNLHVSFHGVNSEALMTKLKSVLAISSGSACTTADPEPSHVLIAMGMDEDMIDSSLRFGLGRFNTTEEVNTAVNAISDAVTQLRKLSPRL